MSLLKKIAAWYFSLFNSTRTNSQEPKPLTLSQAPVLFPSIIIVSKPPHNEEIAIGQLYCVMNSNKPRWSLFKCPCGCGDIITLSLQPMHRPYWRITRTHAGRPNLYPSVWRDKGCLSHFWLSDGRISWCFDTGTHPYQQRINQKNYHDY